MENAKNDEHSGTFHNGNLWICLKIIARFCVIALNAHIFNKFEL